jgi:hypothetical protein
VPVTITGLNNIVANRCSGCNGSTIKVFKGVYSTTIRVNEVPVYVGSSAIARVSGVADDLTLRVVAFTNETVEVKELINEAVTVMKANPVSASVTSVWSVL